MGVPEPRLELEPVAERSVGPDVAGPDEGDEDGQLVPGPEPRRAEGERERVGVDDVAPQVPDAGTAEIAQHREVRCQRQGGQQPERSLEREVATQSDHEHGESLDAEEVTRLHDVTYRGSD